MAMTRQQLRHAGLGTVSIVTTSVFILLVAGCGGGPGQQTRSASEAGLNTVRLEAAPAGETNSHPAHISAQDLATILRGVRSWEERNVFHRLYAGEAPRTRAFRDDEIAYLAPAVSRALSQASATQRVYFRLSHADPTGQEESTAGWVYIQDPDLHLLLSEVHDRHPPGPDISKYDRRMPDVPEVPGAFKVTFEPEEYLAAVKSRGQWFAPDQREELIIRYRDALPSLPAHPLGERPSAEPR
jgi:hypothetical protein